MVNPEEEKEEFFKNSFEEMKKEALSKLFVDLCKIQEDFSKIFPPAPEVITLDNSSE
jgi:hypothetical protein